MKKMFLVFALLSLLMLTNCTDSDDNIINITEPGETEIIAKKLQEFIDENKITTAHVNVFDAQENKWVGIAACNFKLEAPYIQVCGTYYHLSKLVKFELNGYLELYFKY